MAAVSAGLALTGAAAPVTAAPLAVWGLVGTAAPTAWWRWPARAAPDRAELAGSSMVADVKLAMASGAILGRVVFDVTGAASESLSSAGPPILAVFSAIAVARLDRRLGIA